MGGWHNGQPRNPAEHSEGLIAPSNPPFLRVAPLVLLSFSPLTHPPTPNVSAVSKRLPFVRRAAYGSEETG